LVTPGICQIPGLNFFSQWFGTLPYYLASMVFFLIINQVFCPFEEKKLLETFGEEYFSYHRKVRRWI